MSKVTDRLLAEFRLPEINGDRCVHAHIEQASCRACITACPNDAWLLSDDSLGLNTSACDGCGLCVPVCTEQAISQTRVFTIREQEQHRVLMLSCERTGLDDANIACVHAVSYHELLKLYREGIHRILVLTGDCAQCYRSNCEHLASRITNINRILESSQLVPISYSKCPENKWLELWKKPEKSAPGQDMTRRTFFGSLFKQTMDMLSHHFVVDNSEASTPMGVLFPPTQQSDETTYPTVPYIDHTKCNGCDVCIRVCPHEALLLYQDESHLGYVINAATCTACNLCVDICDQSAVSIINWSIIKTTYLPLISQVCQSCGLSFHSPEENQSKHDKNEDNKRILCHICMRITHNKNLFQVIS